MRKNKRPAFKTKSKNIVLFDLVVSTYLYMKLSIFEQNAHTLGDSGRSLSAAYLSLTDSCSDEGQYADKCNSLISGGSRISQAIERKPQRGVRQTIILEVFSRKLHEIEKNWPEGRGRVPSTPLDPPMAFRMNSSYICTGWSRIS